MTAVAPPPNLQTISRSAWPSTNGANSGYGLPNSEEVSRMLMPTRKTASRSNSSSSISSNTSTVSAASQNLANGDASKQKRNSARYLWPISKAEATAGLSTARTQSISSAPGASAMTALKHMPVNGASQISLNQLGQAIQDRTQNKHGSLPDNNPVLFLTPLNGTFERKTITIPYYPDIIRVGRQTNAKTIPTPANGYFDSKVLSRQHAEIWADLNGKIWIRDVKSSNGTFVNGQRLSQENRDSDPHELREQDMLELGIDIVSDDQKTVIHHKVAARVEHAGFINTMESFVLHESGDLMNQPNGPYSQATNHARRNSTPSSFGAAMRGAAGIVNNLNMPRPQGFLLGPVNMEQVIKKLNAEFRLAKQQQNELQRSQQFLDKILLSNTPPPREISHFFGGPSTSKFLPKDLMARFAELPINPPPQGPLPEKPSDFPNHALLRRADTEKPKPSSPLVANFSIFDQSSNSQITALATALDSVKKDYDSQTKKIRDLQDLLVKERVRAAAAEARAHQLENLSIEKALPVKKEEQNITPIEDEANSEIGIKQKAPAEASESATTKLQQKLDLVLAELQQVKENSELWKHGKEKAEKERDQERQERLSLMEMIEAQRKIEKENAARRTRSRSRRRNKSKSASLKNSLDPSLNKAVLSVNDTDEEADERRDSHSAPNSTSPKQLVFTNGHADPTRLHRDGKGGVIYFERSQFIHAAPYLSAMSVVLLGVAVMTLVNKMSRGER